MLSSLTLYASYLSADSENAKEVQRFTFDRLDGAICELFTSQNE